MLENFSDIAEVFVVSLNLRKEAKRGTCSPRSAAKIYLSQLEVNGDFA